MKNVDLLKIQIDPFINEYDEFKLVELSLRK